VEIVMMSAREGGRQPQRDARQQMSVLGSIVTAPILGPFKGLMWLVETLAAHAESELYDEDNIRKGLAALEERFELGEITEEEFETAETALLERLNEARRMKEGS
jgi:hypothetical protein